MKKIFSAFLIILMVLTMVAGCKKPVEEESAATGEYVEGESAPEASGDAPTKVDNPDIIISDDGSDSNDDQQGNTDPDEDNREPSSPSEDNDNEPSDPSADPGDTEDPGDEEPDVEFDEANRLKILDYNIRVSDDGDGKNVADRAPRLAALVEKYDPDVMGFQEAGAKWIPYLEQYFVGEYEMRYKYRAESSLEATPVLWRKDKFELVDEGYFWLSETPDESSMGFGNTKYYRICNWLKLKIKATGKIFLYYNTHMNGDDTSVTGSANLIINRAKAQSGFSQYAVFLNGDFNTEPWSPGYTSIVVDGFFSDVNEALGPDKTHTNNGYNNRAEDHSSNHIIDYAFYSPGTSVPLKYQVLNEEYLGGYISDHRGIYYEVAVL